MTREVSYDKLRQGLHEKGMYKTAPALSLNFSTKMYEDYTKKICEKYLPGVPFETQAKYFGELTEQINKTFDNVKLKKPKDFDKNFFSLSLAHISFLDQDIHKLILDLSCAGFSKSQMAPILQAHILRRVDQINDSIETNGINLTGEFYYDQFRPQQKFDMIIQEMREYSFFDVDLYYKTIDEISRNPDREFVLKNRRNYLDRFKKKDKIAAKLSDDIDLEFKGIHSPQFEYPKKRATEYMAALDFAEKYMGDIFGKDTQSKNGRAVAEAVTNVINYVRNHASDVFKNLIPSHIYAELFWMIQLGRDISKEDLARIGLKPSQIKPILKTVFDQILRYSDASAFSLSTEAREITGYRSQPERLLVNTIKAVLETQKHVLNEHRDVNFMVIVNDKKYMKVKLSVDHSDDMVLVELENAPEVIDLSPEDRYRLRLDAFKNPKDRSALFKSIYGTGDYIVRLTTKDIQKGPSDNNSPFAMTAVGSYKALIDVNMNVAEGIDLALRPAHHHFDGAAAVKVFESIKDHLVLRQEDLKTMSKLHLTKDSDHIAIDPEKHSIALPQAEATATIDDTYKTISIKAGKKTLKIPPPVMRALSLIDANKIPHMHLLYMSNFNASSDPHFDNVQELPLSLDAIKGPLDKYRFAYKDYVKNGRVGPPPTVDPADRREVIRYVSMINKAIDWIVNAGFGVPAVMAAPYGTYRKTGSNAATPIYSNVKILNQGYGMQSCIRYDGKLKFATAEADAYRQTIDIQNALNHMGVIGSESLVVEGSKPTQESTSVYTVKKNPNQAQVAFRRKFIDNPDLVLNDQQKQKIAKVLNQLITNWEKLIFSDMEYGIKNPIVGLLYRDKNYKVQLEKAFKSLMKEYGSENLMALGFRDAESLQRVLNETLVEDTQQTIDPQRIKEAHEVLVGFFEAVGQHSGKTGPLSLVA